MCVLWFKMLIFQIPEVSTTLSSKLKPKPKKNESKAEKYFFMKVQ